MAKHFGKCALCRKECDLSFEHIPPKSAYNGHPAKAVSGTEFIGNGKLPWDISDLHYENLQRGMGKYSLCNNCNNNTGTWYGEEYLKIARAAAYVLSLTNKEEVTSFKVLDFYPLRFVKQVLSMFCSINNFEDKRIERLREFVLDKTATNLDSSKYKLCMYFTESKLQKLNGLSVHIVMHENSFISLALSEISVAPLGFILYFNPIKEWEYKGIDITNFCSANYEEKGEIKFPFTLFEVNSWISEDYRTKEEIEQCVEENKKWEEEHKDELDGI